MYYVGKNDEQLGPFSLEELSRMYTEGELQLHDLVWTDGMEDWQPASTVPELTRRDPPPQPLFPPRKPAPEPVPAPEPEAARISIQKPAPAPVPGPAPAPAMPEMPPMPPEPAMPQMPPQPAGQSWPQVHLQTPSFREPASANLDADIPNHLAFALVVTLCCPPMGLAAVVFALKSGRRQSAGDVAGARLASQEALKWCWIALGCAVLLAIIYTAVYGSAVATGFWEKRMVPSWR